MSIATIYIKANLPVFELIKLAKSVGGEIRSRQGKLYLLTANDCEIELVVEDE